MPSAQQLWNLLTESGLVSSTQIISLQSKFAQMRGAGQGNALLLAEWLISGGVITRYHADVLMAGRHGPFHFGDFQINDRISSGRLGGCFRAIHTPTQHPVLIVFLSGEALQDPSLWPSLVHAAQTLYDVDVSYVVRPHELVDLDIYRFAVLEDLRGTSLSDVLSDGTALPVAQACTIAQSIAIGLADMHRAGIPHGDVRPHNIWLTEKGRAQLLSLPLSRTMLPTRPPLELKQCDYAAPEVNPNVPVATPVADIYALGSTLYQMLAGRAPFQSPSGVNQTIAEKMQRHAVEPIVPLHQLGNVSQAVNQIVSYMMAKNVDVRYGSARTIVEALEPHIDLAQAGRSPKTIPTRLAYETLAKRRRGAVVVAAAASRPPDGTATFTATRSAASTSAEPPTSVATSGGPSAGTPPAVGDSSLQEILKIGTPQASGSTPVIAGNSGHAPGAPNRLIKKSTKNALLAVGMAAAFALLVGTLLMTTSGPVDPDDERPVASDGTDNSTDGSATTDGGVVEQTDGKSDGGTVATPKSEPSGPYENLIVDDGKRLWGTPTHGDPPDIRYIPGNPQVLFLIRPSALLDDQTGKEMLAAMGPAGEDLIAWIVDQTGYSPSEINRLDIALYEDPSDRPRVVTVAQLHTSQTVDQLLTRWKNPDEDAYNGVRYYRRGVRGYYLPADRKDVFSVGDIEQIREVIDFLDESASDSEWFSRPFKELVKSTDAERHINVLFSSNYLRSARDALYPGRLAPMHEAISWLLGPSEELQGGLFSVHVSSSFFAELRLYCVRGKPPRVLAADFHARLGEIPRRLNAHLLSLSISLYSRAVLAVLPDMFRSLYQYTRHDQDRVKGRQAVLRCYLPAGAAKNIIMATDLALLETAGTAGSGGETRPPSVGVTVSQKLKQRTSLVFGEDNLIQSLVLLSNDIGVKIEIQGKDLEADGITKNQSFGINMRDKTAEEILVQIMLRANPDKTASGPTDPRLKLIFVVKEKLDGGDDVIWVTTRTAAASRGDKIPEVFQATP